MAFRVSDFYNVLNKYNETSRSDKFNVYFTIPPSIASEVNMKDLSLLCEVSELPGRDIGMIEYRHYGFIQRIPHMNTYGIANFTFICTGTLAEKRLFDRWLDLMVPAQNGLVTYPFNENGESLYETTVIINQYDLFGNYIYQVRLIDAMPISVSPINQSWSDDSIQRLNVSFVFRKWKSSETTQGVSAASIPPNNYSNTLQQKPVNLLNGAPPPTNIYLSDTPAAEEINQTSSLEQIGNALGNG